MNRTCSHCGGPITGMVIFSFEELPGCYCSILCRLLADGYHIDDGTDSNVDTRLYPPLPLPTSDDIQMSLL
jgi:hypothetical protein